MVRNQPSALPDRSSPVNSLQIEVSPYAACSYFKVPADQRSANPQVYTPHLFSFGPYHAAHDHCVSCFGPYHMAPHAATPLHQAPPFTFSPPWRGASADFSADSESVHSIVPYWHAASSDPTLEGGDLGQQMNRLDSAKSSAQESGADMVSVDDGIHTSFRNMLSVSSSFRTRVSIQPLSCATLVPNEGDHFKHLVARAVGLRDRSQLIDKIKQHDLEFRNMYVQMSQAQLDLIDAGCLADLLALDGIAIVAATMPHNVTRLIYPITRLILSDAILLENQVPVLVLKYAPDSITSMAPRNESPPPTLEKVLKWYRQHMSPFLDFECDPPPSLSTHMKESLLLHVYDYLTQAKCSDVLDKACIDSQCLILDSPALPTASHLARCGVTFRPCRASFKGICFDEKNTVLYIPRIGVSDTTVRFLHNLLAYEATARYPAEFSVTSYAHFMDCLIDTEDDCQVLVEAGVICNALGSLADLASMWNKLCTSVSCRITPEDYQYMKQLEALSKRRLRRWRAAFKEKYWERQPWLLISLLAATILLVLTVLQTIYTIKSPSGPRIHPWL